MSKLEKIILREEDFAGWYTSIINNAELCLYGPIKGTIIFQPNGWSIWESIHFIIDKEFKKINIKNVYLPFLIPLEDFEKEKAHIEGFAPELYTVTKIGNKKLDKDYVIRPTSEITFCKYFKHITSSYKNLPIKLNQWCSVMRAEKTPRPFLRNCEFHWQEMHSIHETKDEAILFTKNVLDIYEKFVKDILCIPVIKGEKTIGERFAGAENTYTIEALMQDGQMLQCGTSHYLGQSFSKPYEIKFQTKNNDFDFVHQVSAGISTRLIGAIIMVHGDDKGLILPPKIAPVQIMINTIGSKKNPKITDVAIELRNILLNANYRVEMDDSDKGLGYKLAENEIKGTPFQIIIGNDTLSNNFITVIRRDMNIKEEINIKDITDYIEKGLNDLSVAIYKRAEQQLNNSIVEVKNVEELKNVLENKKIAKVFWSGDVDDEKKIKEITGATPRCSIENKKEGICFFTNKKTNNVVIFGRAY